MFESVTDVSIDDLTTALSQFGTRGAAELGYFHAVQQADNIPILFRVSVPVVGDPEAPYGATYARGTIDYSDKGLSTPPKLLGVLEGISPNHTSSFDFTNITATSVDYTVRQSKSLPPYSTLPLDATFTILALT